MFALRPYQDESINLLRERFKEGHVRQVLAASTGSGKSIVMMSMIKSSLDKEKRSLFICERRILVDQFSRHLDSMNIDHGVYMSGHWRFRPHALVQVASIQTLEKMDQWPIADVYFVDELHACMRKSLIKFIEKHPDKKICGATATPFHPEIGKHFSSVVSVISMRELVDSGNLVPFKVFVAKEIDTDGLKVVAGEWKKDDLEERGRIVTGDIVSDYVRLSHQVFGSYRKTICFSCGVAHGTDLTNRFNEIGINTIQISYRDSDEFKSEVLREFAKPDTDIKILVSSAILERGFDQTDVEHVILARPLKKSFSSHVQMVGRGARTHEGKEFCIASGQRVLTHRGLVPIEKVLINDKLWDGESFVSHGGVIYKGYRNVITYQGLTATPDHRVKTKEGWRSIGYCASKQISIIKTGLGGHQIRESENIFSGSCVEGRPMEEAHVCSLRMPNMLQKICHFIQQLIKRHCWWVCEMQSTKNYNEQICSQESRRSKTKVSERHKYSLPRLWWERYRVSIQDCFRWLFMGYGKLANTGEFEELSVRQNRQQWPLRSREYSVVYNFSEFITYQKTYAKRDATQIQDRKPIYTLCGSYSKKFIQRWVNKHTNNREISQAKQETKRQVWDILNSGARNCFTCEGLLVHNCVIQDNAGNWLRFQDEWNELYHNGVTELNLTSDKKPKKEKTKEQKEAAKCPKCSALWPPKSDTCSHCGHVRERRNEVQVKSGELVEVGATAKNEKFDAAYKESFYQQLLKYANDRGYREGYAYHKYRDRFKINPAWKKVKADFVSKDVLNFITSLNIKRAYRKRA